MWRNIGIIQRTAAARPSSPDVNFIQCAGIDELLDDVVERRKLAHDWPRDAVVAALIPETIQQSIDQFWSMSEFTHQHFCSPIRKGAAEANIVKNRAPLAINVKKKVFGLEKNLVMRGCKSYIIQ